MKSLLNLLLKTTGNQRRHPPKPTTSGFTMIELLVGMVIAFLIIVPMLAFVVDILNRDVQEQVKGNAEQDVQAAVDYITQDMSQAVHIYTAEEVQAIEDMDDTDRPIPLPDGSDPILVFWKRSYEENALPADSSIAVDDAAAYCADEANEDNCNDTFVMSLVAYYRIEDSNTTWCQPTGDTCSRIARAEISDGIKYEGVYINDEAQDTDGDGINDAPGKGFNPANIGNRTDVANLLVGVGDLPSTQVLVNYLEVFKLERVSTSQKLATIKLVGNALRRSESDATCEETPATNPPTYKKSSYCPTVTVQVGGRSGFGTSEE